MKEFKIKTTWFFVGVVSLFFVQNVVRFFDHVGNLEVENIHQKQTIYRLNNQLSKMDTLHDECFKVSEIRKNK